MNDIVAAVHRQVASVPKALAALVAMEAELTSAGTYEKIDKVIREAGALQLLFKGVREVEQRAQLTIVLGKRRIGEELKKVPKATGKKLAAVQDSKAGTGIEQTERHRLGKLASVPEPVLRETVARLQDEDKDATVHAVLKEITYGDKKSRRDAHLKKTADRLKALPDKRYGLIYLDPEWKFETRSEKGKDRAADNHYSTSAFDVIKARDIASLAGPNCILMLWITVPFIGRLSELLDAWGFEYKSMLTWDKEKIAHGYWFRGQTEHLVIATRGKVAAPARGKQLSSLWREKAGEHSTKPEGILDWIDAQYPAPFPKIELNRRGPAREGWDAHGPETEE